MQSTDEIYRALEARRSELGLSQAEVSQRAFGKQDSGALQSIRRGAVPSVAKLDALGKVLGLSFSIGAPSALPADGPDGFAEAAVESLAPTIDGSPEALRMGYLPIPFHADQTLHVGAAHVAVARSWLADREIDVEKLSFVVAPNAIECCAVRKGDLLLVDGGKVSPDGAGLVAISFERSIVLSRLDRLSKGDYFAIDARKELPAGRFRILGEVVRLSV